MGSDDLFWKRKKGRLKRRIRNRGIPKPTFLIVCEGQCTEPYYFRSFKVSTADVVIEGLGYNTISLVKRAITLKNKTKKDICYDQVWVVLDRNNHPLQNFNNAFVLAEKHAIKIAYSNEAFELWYLLHFHYFNSAISRNVYISKLNRLLGHKYCKNSKKIYDELIESQQDAIKKAKRLLNSYSVHYSPQNANPSTTVHLLVEELNKYL